MTANSKKANGEFPKAVVGVKLIEDGRADKKDNPTILISCTSKALFSVHFLITSLFIFCGMIVLSILVCLFCIYRSFHLARLKREEESQINMEKVNTIMPIKSF